MKNPIFVCKFQISSMTLQNFPQISIEINKQTLTVHDLRGVLTATDLCAPFVLTAPTPPFLTFFNIEKMRNVAFQLPFIAIKELDGVLLDTSFLSNTNLSNSNSEKKIPPFDLCIAPLDLIIAAEEYFYAKSKLEYEAGIFKGRKPFMPRASRIKKMLLDEFSLRKSLFNLIDEQHWAQHQADVMLLEERRIDLLRQMNYKVRVVQKKGVEDYYDRSKAVGNLYQAYGVMVRLQSGRAVKQDDLVLIKKLFNSFYTVFGNLTPLCKSFGLLISYSGDAKVRGKSRRAGEFIPAMRAMTISNETGVERIFAHEFAHCIDYYLAEKTAANTNFLSENKTHLAYQIAAVFNANMRARQTSKYQNEARECFARAFEQHFALAMNIAVEESNYCEPLIFKQRVAPLIGTFITRFFE